MAQGPTTTIRCPRCHHPYPMTPTQLSVYVGRKMGCMACGKPFEVQPPPEPDPLVTAQGDSLGVPGGFPGMPAAAPAFAPEAYGAGAYGAGDPAAVVGVYGAGDPTAGWPVAAGTPGSARTAGPPAAAPSPPTWLDRAAVSAGVAFLVLVTVAAIAGYAGSAPDGGTATAASGVAPRVLLRVAIGFAAAAVLMGAARLWQTRRRPTEPGDAPRRRDRGHAAAAVGLGATELLAAAVLALVVWPPMARALGEGHKATCQENLQQLGTLLLSEATARRDGKFPDSLSALVGEGKLSPAAAACPAAEDAGTGPSADPAATSGAQGSYIYLGQGMATKAAGGTRVGTHTVLAYERPGHHGTAGGLHVLFADGTVVFVEKDEATALMAELTAGKNPPPSAGLVRK